MAMSDVPQLVVLDLAGTTVRDRGEVPAAFAAALAEEGIAVSAAALHAVRGAAKRQAVLQLIPPGPARAARAARTYDTFQRLLLSRYAQDGVAAIPGAAAAFAWWRARGVRVVLDTGFDREITGHLLTALGWQHDVVDGVVCGDDVAHGRPAPDLILMAMARTGVTAVERVAAVGDTVLDLQAGHLAGARWNVGVLSGAHQRDTLAAAPHTHLLDSVADLPALFDPR
jgi:phosphonatase-like hydrolase